MEAVLDTNFCSVYHLGGNYYKVHYKEVELQLDDYLILIGKAKEYSAKDGKLFFLYTQAQHFSIDKGTWAYIKKNAHKYDFIKANAVVVDDLPQRLMTKLFMFFSKNHIPSKAFSKEEKAFEWLKEMSKKIEMA